MAPKTFEPKKTKKNKKLAVPNFERFRLLLVAGGLILLLLIGGLIFALTALPKAVISIKTDATTVDTSLPLLLSTTAKTANPDDGTIPAKLSQQSKTSTQQVPTTGQKNNGNKASGTVNVVNCSDDPVTIPAGTGFSSSGNTYISQESATIQNSDFNSKNECKKNKSGSVNIIAQSGGASFNKPAGASFTVAYSSNILSGQGGNISGGTDSIVQTVNQNDISNAKAKLSASDDEVKQTLASQIKKDGMYAIIASFAPGTPTVTTSANVGDVANNVTVTQTTNYTMFGVSQDDLKTLIENSIKDQIDTEKQTILDNGLDKAVFNVDNLSATGGQLTLTTTASAGPDLNVATIKHDAAGKKAGEIKSQLKSNPDVTDVEVKLSPFWVSSVPKKDSRIKVEIAKPVAKAENSPNAR